METLYNFSTHIKFCLFITNETQGRQDVSGSVRMDPSSVDTSTGWRVFYDSFISNQNHSDSIS
jgi:hypothetical protein